MTLAQFYLADRQAKNERATKFEDTLGEQLAKLETFAIQMRKMRQEAISLQMIGHEFVAMHQKIPVDSEAMLIESRNVLRRLATITVLSELVYGPAFWNLTRSIGRGATLTKWRLSTICNVDLMQVDNIIDLLVFMQQTVFDRQFGVERDKLQAKPWLERHAV